MNLTDVMAEVAAKLDAIPDLRVLDYHDDVVNPPMAFVSLPGEITYDQTYGRGADALTLNVLILVGMASTRGAHKSIKKYADGSGAHSVKAALDVRGSNTYTSCDDVTVTDCTFDVWIQGDVRYLGVEFTVSIYGAGS